MHNYIKTLTFTAILASAALPAMAVSPNIEKNKQEKASAWADSVFATLTTRQKVAQIIFPKLIPTKGDESVAAIKKLVKTNGFGGLLFSEGTIEQYVSLANIAQEEATVPVLMTFDGEWGISMRVANTPRFPKNIALGAIKNKRLIYDYGREVARECKLIGVQVNFAPDADINSNPSNPVIGTRSFGEDPQRVAEAVVAYSLGLEDAGVQAVAKHFPGHGDTSTDSHKALTSVSHTKERLAEVDLEPFKQFTDAGCSGVMMGHIIVPSIDPSLTPASLSRVLTSGLLRKETGFEGLIYTDALGMKGAADPTGRNNAISALLAGADVLLCPINPVDALNTILGAMENGTVEESVIADRCKRVLRYKYYLGLNDYTPLGDDYDAIAQSLNSPEALALVQKLADASITVVRNEDNLLPFGDLTGKKFAVVNIGADSGKEFDVTCMKYADCKPFSAKSQALSEATLKKIEESDAVIAAVFDDNASARTVLAQLVAASKPVIAVFMTSPFKIRKFAASLPKLKVVVLGYDDIPQIRLAAAEALFGGIAVDGRLPVNIAGLAKAGAGISLPKSRLGFSSPVAEGFNAALTDSLDALINRGLESKAFPGCQLLVARNGKIVYDKSFGKISVAPGSADVTPFTVYDLASVSKATGTLPGIMKAYDQGCLTLDDKLGDVIPQITDSAKKEITVRELLYHETGMPAALNMFDVMFDTLTYTGRLITSKPDKTHTIKIQKNAYGNNAAKMRTDIVRTEPSDTFPIEVAKGIFGGKITYDTVMSRIYNAPLRSSKKYNYSCLNFSLLMDVEQRSTGKPHQEYVYNGIFGPIGAYNTGYRPTEWQDLSNIAVTEYDSFLRRQKMHGYVHDELANFSGGVQGNAGLFSSASDLAKICQMWLNEGSYGDVQVLSPETVRLFTTAKSPTCRRGLGFDKPDTENPDYSPTCDEASPEVYGHLGFTGTVFWVDPKEQIIFIFLTNRVDPTRDTPEFNKLNLRPNLFRQVYHALNK